MSGPNRAQRHAHRRANGRMGLFEKGIDAKGAKARPQMALSLAAMTDDGETARLAIASGADPMAHPGRGGASPFFHAAESGSSLALRAMLPIADPLFVDIYGRCALARACAAGQFECVRILAPVSNLGPAAAPTGPLAPPAPFDWRPTPRTATPLMIAAAYGHAEIARFLLPLSNPRDVDDEGRDAIAHAREGAHHGLATEIEAWEIAQITRASAKADDLASRASPRL